MVATTKNHRMPKKDKDGLREEKSGRKQDVGKTILDSNPT